MIKKAFIFFASGIFLRWAILGFPSFESIASYWVASDALIVTGFLKVMREELWIPFTAIKSARLSFPEGLDFAQWPMTDVFHWSSLHLINLFSSTSTVAYNLYFIIGAGLITTSMGFLCLSLGLGFPLALTAGLAYSSLPFGFERLHHLFLAMYFQVPLIFYVLLNFQKKMSWYVFFSMGAFVGLTGIYYAFFSSVLVGLFFLVSILGCFFGWSNSEFRILFTNSVSYMGGKLLFLAISMLPNWIYLSNHGDPNTTKRSPGESLIWALDVENILLPPTSHWFPPYASIRSLFFSWEKLKFMSDYEGYAEYLGVLSLFGLGLCIYHSVRLFRGAKKTTNPIFLYLGFIALICLGLALRYGLGYLFAITVSPQIRSWNRASLFIATAGLIAFFIWIQPIIAKHIPKNYIWAPCLGILIFFLAEAGTIWRPITPDRAQIISDMTFSQEVKSVVGDKPVIGLPFGFFPEWRGYASVETYGNFRYLQFETIHSIFPSIKGTLETNRKMELFFGRYPNVVFLLNYGVVGIVIDRKDFPDNGAEVISIYSALKTKKIQSADGRFYFVSLQ